MNKLIMKRTIRLTESDLHRIIFEAAKKTMDMCWSNKWEEREQMMRDAKNLEEMCKIDATLLPGGRIIFDFEDEYYSKEDYDEFWKISFYPEIDAEFNRPSYTIIDIDYDIVNPPKISQEEFESIVKKNFDRIAEEMCNRAERRGYDLVY